MYVQKNAIIREFVGIIDVNARKDILGKAAKFNFYAKEIALIGEFVEVMEDASAFQGFRERFVRFMYLVRLIVLIRNKESV